MGLKIFNLHVYKGDLEQIKAVLPNDLTAVSISPDWVSIMGNSRDFMLDELIEAVYYLSSKISQPILNYVYFEEESMGINLFKQSEDLATFGINRFSEAQADNIENFFSELDVNRFFTNRLRKIFTCEDYYQATEMLEELFGVALIVNKDFIEDGTDEFIRRREDKIYNNFFNEEKRQDKFEGKAAVELVQEFDGKLHVTLFTSSECNIFEVSKRDEDGIYSHYDPDIYSFNNDRLKQLFKMARPASTFDKWHINKGRLLIYREFYRINERKYYCMRIKNNGDLINDYNLCDEAVKIITLLDNEDIIYQTFDGRHGREEKKKVYIKRVNRDSKVLWEYEVTDKGIMSLKYSSEGVFILTYNHDKPRRLIKLDTEGKEVGVSIIKNYSANFVIADDHLYYLSHGAGGRDKNFVKLDLSLNEIWVHKIDDKIDVFDEHLFYSEIAKQIICRTLNDEVFVYNLHHDTYKAFEVKGMLFVGHVDRHGNIYVNKGMSTVLIYDKEMNLLSKHRLKGSVRRYIENSNGIYVVTGTGDAAFWGKENEKDNFVRLYKIQWT